MNLTDALQGLAASPAEKKPAKKSPKVVNLGSKKSKKGKGY
jgi:hypothetical protein